MSKRKLDKTDIGEMHCWANSALHSGFLKVEIDSDHAMELCERSLDNSRLTEENARLREILEMVIFESERNFDNSIDIESLKEELNQLKEQSNDNMA